MSINKITPLDTFVSNDAPICYGILKPGDHYEGGIPVIKVKNIIGGVILEDDLLKTTPEIHAQYKRAEVKEGDILLTIRGTTGRVAIVPNSLNGANITQDTARIRVSSNDDSLYIFYALQSFNVQQQITLNTVGQAVKGINIAEVKKLKIYHPILDEQKAIAQILSTWDQAISATEKLLENSQQQKKALMQQLLTGKKRLLDEARSRFNISWEKHRLGIFLKEEKQRNKDNSISRVLSVTNHSGFILPENQFSKRIASDEVSNYKVVRQGQYGYNPSRINVGSFARLDQFENGLLSPMYVVFSIKSENLDSDFFLYWMKSNEAKQRINNSTQGSVRDSVGFDAISSFVLKLPEIQEQRKIAKVLSFADQEIETLQKKLNCLKQEKKALMQQLLTGKRRVKLGELK
ncbi:hypothetical protein KAM398_22300 [Acinetobacter sp. KAM398]|jgi:type I restriction enzyme S subunit|uniref:restriction endonuclease subunit S n=1 Tax=Acinetobacter TaxID=469 RepID=UPI00111F63A7|nr:MULTISPECIES: restriction endonuclease subunit S [Acinetobacter]GJC32231.1 hypothetical protein KAM392_22100 [Acinetobacter sp. KAM392]GJC35093.1 hypothetical protein KAM393_22620 [Acinetobacter sp. KAM393]GJC37881.1 hypothetical protein KAM394_22210 [Acinetobacter sp. KAM394]GJC40741.1 hypothetical protein KAM395_22620 [Acinetobacter sp. KAM395]GJC43550.1 hypothetical protein KAM396_22470 [Acinetobacter sp. KAM396]